MELPIENRCTTATAPESWTELVAQFEKFAKDYCIIKRATVEEQKTYISRFYERFKPQSPTQLLSSLSRRSIQDFLFQYAKNHGTGSRRWMQYTLKTFLRFCHHKRYISVELSAAVPVVHQRRLANLPKAIDDAAVQRLLETIDTSTPLGMRDYAILQLLITYGVRGIHVRTLILHDIDWRNSRIDFHSTKGGKPISQHLTEEVGNSLLRYIRHARPVDTPYSEVFLTATSPPHPFHFSGSLSSIFARRLHRAEITLPDGVSKGTHSFRHRFAKNMLDNDMPLKFIADMLGHRDINSTFIYSKVALQALRQAALEWPKENPS